MPGLVSIICRPVDVVTGLGAGWAIAPVGMAVEPMTAIATAVQAPINIRIDPSPLPAPSLYDFYAEPSRSSTSVKISRVRGMPGQTRSISAIIALRPAE